MSRSVAGWGRRETLKSSNNWKNINIRPPPASSLCGSMAKLSVSLFCFSQLNINKIYWFGKQQHEEEALPREYRKYPQNIIRTRFWNLFSFILQFLYSLIFTIHILYFMKSEDNIKAGENISTVYRRVRELTRNCEIKVDFSLIVVSWAAARVECGDEWAEEESRVEMLNVLFFCIWVVKSRS